jgi:hypothetical protein
LIFIKKTLRFRVTDTIHLVVMDEYIVVATSKLEIKIKILKRLWQLNQFMDYYMVKFDLINDDSFTSLDISSSWLKLIEV